MAWAPDRNQTTKFLHQQKHLKRRDIINTTEFVSNLSLFFNTNVCVKTLKRNVSSNQIETKMKKTERTTSISFLIKPEKQKNNRV